MPKVFYISPEGERTELDVTPGTSLMRAAVNNGIHGIVGDCGGSASCATCHVYVDQVFLDKLPPITASEDEMLEGAASERKPNSRLSCQLIVTEELDGIVVRLPDQQW